MCRSITTFITLLAIIATAMATMRATRHTVGVNGPIFEQTVTGVDSGSYTTENAVDPLIHDSRDKSIYSGNAIGNGLALTAIWDVPPIEVEAFSLQNPAKPLWQHVSKQPSWDNADNWDVKVARGPVKIPVATAFYSGPGNFTVTVAGVSEDGSIVWHYEYTDVETDLTDLHPMEVSDDGKYAVVALYSNVSLLAPGKALIDVFNLQTGDILCHLEPEFSNSAIIPMLTKVNGKFALINVGTEHVVIELNTCKLRPIYTSTYISTDPVYSISADGQYTSDGFEQLYVRKWNGKEYELSMNLGIPGHLITSTALAEGVVVVIWSTFTFSDKTIRVYDVNSQTLQWEYNTTSTGKCQMVSQNIAFTSDGQHFSIASWGDCDEPHTEAQIMAFDIKSNIPILKYYTPGSMFWTSIDENDDGKVFVAAGGKHVHANVMGDGGDFYTFNV